MTQAISKAYESKVLDPERHERLINQIESVSSAANIPISMLWTSMKSFCNHEEIKFVTNLRGHEAIGVYGFAYVGDEGEVLVLNRMMAVTGACLRNFVNARVMPLHEVLQGIKKHDLDQPTVLLIPDFFMGKKEGSNIADWQVSGLLSLLFTRQTLGLQTFVYVSNLQELGLAYGPAFRKHIETNFVRTSA